MLSLVRLPHLGNTTRRGLGFRLHTTRLFHTATASPSAMAPKRKRSAAVDDNATVNGIVPPLPKRRSSARNIATATVATNPDQNADIIDAPNATRASPDSDVNEDIVPGPIKLGNGTTTACPLSDAPAVAEAPKKKGRGKKAVVETEGSANIEAEAPGKKGRGKKPVKAEDDGEASVAEKPAPKKAKTNADDEAADPEADEDEEADEEEVKEALTRPPPVNSDYLPLPWKGRLGYACLNTYLRQSNPPVFSSRTCRIQSILEHRHPLKDPSQPEHATKNRPDRDQPPGIERGQRYVEELCLTNVKDIIKMVRWNDRYNIKFFRLSSEMFPFASHPEYGYKLAPFASEALAEAGKVIAELGHRVTTHPGQFTQLGSPRQPVIDNAIRDLEYHDELLSLLKLPEQQDKDAVMILHMGGVFDGKEGVIERFRENYANLSQSVKNRLVLENDDVSWTVHDLLPICEELNIPMVLDYHHHNIMFDADKIREGTKDIIDLYPRIKATWDRKGIKQKMHYSEPTPAAITGRQRRKHNPRVATLPPSAQDMDIMIEAKDKEQAVFELMRIFKLPGFDTFNDILPYVRNDDNKAALAAMNKKKKIADEPEPELIPDDEVGMGGPEGRVYWPPGMEEWLRPKKREVKKKEAPAGKSLEEKKAEAAKLYADAQAKKAVKDQPASEHEDSDVEATPATKKAKAAMKKKAKADAEKAAVKAAAAEVKEAQKAEDGAPKKRVKVKREPQAVPTPSSSEGPDDVELDDVPEIPVAPQIKTEGSRKGGRRSAKSAVSYKEED
ncbi:UV-damage endonuclease [Fulvia fulva]|uniref:UV-damage endonuclease n=1 Tax=Passalora fulva TaxID=5499 RepID=A0A9Q8L7N0_PASFU|nr:UV-damage endonuclease [Fulvia fulva]KAK4637597.1 UV-damage endonuclease [Fulvia fulva]UJO12367.1 UV-damage endonuclease [Fulvia fulva]